MEKPARIDQPHDLGRLIREKRKGDGLKQADAAMLCGVSIPFFSEVENGKETAQIGKVLQVLQGMGLEVVIQPRGWKG